MHTHNIDMYSAISYALSNNSWDLEFSSDSPPKITIDDNEYYIKENENMSKTPSKREYERALETVQKYEERQQDLAKLNRDLGFALKRFDQIKFDVNESKKEVTFTGVTKDGKLKLTKSVARSGDRFEEVIGKLISVKKALGEDIEWIDKFVESDSNVITIDSNNIKFNTEWYKTTHTYNR